MSVGDSGRVRAGRPERSLDAGESPVAAFAHSLRQLRRAAGGPSYRELSRQAMFAPSVLSTAASGTTFPSRRVAMAFVSGCGGDVADWGRRWDAVAAALAASAGSGDLPVARPSQLPPQSPHYVGRQAECARLFELTDPGRSPRAAAVAISGPVGVGKTALALHFAHLAAARYPDGQLYADIADCRAHGQSPDDLIGRLLRALGLADDQLPGDRQQRAGLYRTILAERRVLVMLDGAGTESEVRPLLATGSSSLVVVTSRSRLSGLDNVRRLSLDVLPASESLALISAVVGQSRTAAEAEACAALGELCGYLPLAVWIAATHLADHRTWTVDYAVQRLRDPAARLDWLCAGDVSVRHRIRSAYRQLNASARRAFRRIGCAADGAGEVDALALGCQLGVPAGQAERLLETLVEGGLLQVSDSTARYRVPVLFAAHARNLPRNLAAGLNC